VRAAIVPEAVRAGAAVAAVLFGPVPVARLARTPERGLGAGEGDGLMKSPLEIDWHAARPYDVERQRARAARRWRVGRLVVALLALLGLVWAIGG
jgi:hypothetical protein